MRRELVDELIAEPPEDENCEDLCYLQDEDALDRVDRVRRK